MDPSKKSSSPGGSSSSNKNDTNGVFFALTAAGVILLEANIYSDHSNGIITMPDGTQVAGISIGPLAAAVPNGYSLLCNRRTDAATYTYVRDFFPDADIKWNEQYKSVRIEYAYGDSVFSIYYHLNGAKDNSVVQASVAAPNGTTTRVNVIYDRGRTYMDVNALRQFVREYSGGSSASSSGGSNISRDYTELADIYGKNSYSTSDRLLNAKPVELIARAIYGEMTKASEQLAVAWTMVNRVIAQQKSIYAGGLATSLLNVVKHPKAYAALEGEGGNRQSFNSYTSSNSGWLNAITLAQKMLDVLDKHYPRDVAYAHSDRVIIRNEVSSSIGHSPIGGATYYRTTTQFDELVRKEDGKDKYLGNEIYGIYKSGSHTYFSYIKEADYDYGL